MHSSCCVFHVLLALLVFDLHGRHPLVVGQTVDQRYLHEDGHSSSRSQDEHILLQTSLVAAEGRNARVPTAPAASSLQRTTTAWIYAFGRSSSTTLQRLIALAETIEAKKFLLFEPCHHGDVAHFENCLDEMEAIMKCDYAQVEWLHWWGKSYEGVTSGSSIHPYTSTTASQLCNAASLRVFKTIHMHGKSSSSLLQTVGNLRIIMLIRDPRGMYISSKERGMIEASLKSALEPEYVGLSLQQVDSNAGLRYIAYMCEQLLEQSGVNATGVLKVRWEDLVLHGVREFRKLFEFLDIQMTNVLQKEVAKEYPGMPTNMTAAERISTFASLNHFNDASWTLAERIAFSSCDCKAALRAWDYPDAFLGRAIGRWSLSSLVFTFVFLSLLV